MDRLPDIRRAAAPKTRPEVSERSPRDGGRAPRARGAEKSEGAAGVEQVERADPQTKAERAEHRKGERSFRVEVEAAEAAREPVQETALEGEVVPAAAAEEVELAAQQPVLRAKASRVDPGEVVRAPSKQEHAVVVPLAVPTLVDPVVAAGSAPPTEVRAIEGQGAPRAIVPQVLPPVVVAPAPAPAVEAAPEVRETRPTQDLERAADILRQVRVHIVPRTSEAHIHLEPRDLGRVSIDIQVEDGRMRAVVRAERPEALDAIQAHLPELRATLRDTGITSQEFQFSLGLENQPRRDGRQAGNEEPRQSPSRLEAHEPEHAVLLRATASASGVDLYA